MSNASPPEKTLVLWQGHHHQGLLILIEQAWNKKIQLIIVPPLLNDFSFLNSWNGSVLLEGSWNQESQKKVQILLEKIKAKTSSSASSHSSWPEDKTLGLFTSGTASGVPRLVLFSQENLLISLESIRKLYQTTRIEQIFCYPQPTHVFGFVLGYLQSFLYKIPLITLQAHYSREAHKLWHQTVNKNTLTLGTPAHFSDLLTWLHSEKLQAPTSYSCIAGGAPVSLKLWKRLQNELNIEAPSIGYGATEASLGISHLPPGAEPQEDSVIGTIFPHVTIHQMDQQGFVFSGPNLAEAIWNGVEFTYPKQFLLNDILVEKNDKTQTSKQNYFIFEGRSDLLINRGGLKVSPESVETILEAELGLNSIVIGYPNERLGNDICILFEKNSKENIPSLIQQLVAERFGFRINHQLLIELEEGHLPKSNNGKKDRTKALKVAIRRTHPFNTTIPIELLKSFMPHRQSAIWIDRVVEYRPHFGRAEIVINKNASYLPLTSAEAIEWVAQTYGYSRVVNEIFELQKLSPTQKTLIAEIKSFENLSPQAWKEIQPGDLIEAVALCTHDFDPLFVVEGEVFKNKSPIAKLNLKLYAGL